MALLDEDFRGSERPLPWAGIIASAIGFGMFFAYWQFASVSQSWSGTRKLVYLAVAGGLVVWGILNGAFGRRDGSAQAGLPLSRNRVLLPKQGLVYLLIMAVLFVGSLLGRTNMLMLVFAMMTGPFVLNGWITFSMLKRMSIARRTPPRAMAGEPVSVEVELTNGKRVLSAWLMTVTDRIQNRRERLGANVVFARVPPRSRRSAPYQLRLMQRGKYTFGPIQVTTRFPLGLVERGLVFAQYDDIIIHPRLGKLSSAWKREHLLATELVHRRRLRRGVFDDEFQSIREYRWGDNPRAIHWRTSARRNEVMVREFHQSRDQDLVVLLDLWKPVPTGATERDRVELAVSLAATICVAQMRQSRDCRIALFAAGREFTRWEGYAGPVGIESLLDTLALVESSSTPDIDELAREARARSSPNTSLILISPRPQRSSAIGAAPAHQPAAAAVGARNGNDTGNGNGEGWFPRMVHPPAAGPPLPHVSAAAALRDQFRSVHEGGARFQFVEADSTAVQSFFELD